MTAKNQQGIINWKENAEEWLNGLKKQFSNRDDKNKYRIQPVFCSLQGESVADKINKIVLTLQAL